MENIQFHMCEDFYDGKTKIWLRQKMGDVYYTAQTIVFEKTERGFYAPPCLEVDSEAGLPEQIKQSLKAMGRLSFADQETLKAKDFHLEDMRRLVFKDKK